jgi:hypothetical protein
MGRFRVGATDVVPPLSTSCLRRRAPANAEGALQVSSLGSFPGPRAQQIRTRHRDSQPHSDQQRSAWPGRSHLLPLALAARRRS